MKKSCLVGVSCSGLDSLGISARPHYAGVGVRRGNGLVALLGGVGSVVWVGEVGSWAGPSAGDFHPFG